MVESKVLVSHVRLDEVVRTADDTDNINIKSERQRGTELVPRACDAYFGTVPRNMEYVALDLSHAK